MQFSQPKLGIHTQIWNVLDLLGEDYTFYGLGKFLGCEDETLENLGKGHDVLTYPFYNLIGHAHGFTVIVKKWSLYEKPALFFTVTQHGSCDEICVIDWTAMYDFQHPPMTHEDRPENARVAHFAYGATGNVVNYVRHLIALHLVGKTGQEFRTEGVLGIENVKQEVL